MFHSGGLHVLPTKIRLGWKAVQVANTLAYYDTAIISGLFLNLELSDTNCRLATAAAPGPTIEST